MKSVALEASEIQQLIDVVSVYPEVEEMLIFGSRAMGNAKPGSDIDIALVGSAITLDIVVKVKDYLEEETLLPYFFDVVHFDSLENSALKKHIREHGIVVYGSQ